MPSACTQRGRPSEVLGRTVSQSAGSETCVANCSITPSSSTNVIRRLVGEYVAYYHEDRTHYALEKETPGWAVCITGTTGLRRRMGGWILASYRSGSEREESNV